MSQASLFTDPPQIGRVTEREREEWAKRVGMTGAVNRRRVWLSSFRCRAILIAREGDGTCDIDLVRAYFDAGSLDYPLGNWMGSVFRDTYASGLRVWGAIGWIQTTHRDGHGRPVRRWRLKE